jgi:hypothetical protein
MGLVILLSVSEAILCNIIWILSLDNAVPSSTVDDAPADFSLYIRMQAYVVSHISAGA